MPKDGCATWVASAALCFLDVAALAAGQTTKVSAISRDAGVSRETARGYFGILTDTPN